ncbi:transporter substrate-binding domain-containing protein [Pseudobacteriovorax antillogorgiicola]|uniref:ABC-type amino acid transport substrate-binding protein n=1 Tax=Pseudobacteriovorax antillogorgiicola TaxID=1513793 RepID=A0A1Y6BZ76_9BACT|nr:transporter substrate-binding domain-containing protein [Pseudobacteriovorax antillogorgiicola]TCS51223.1 ABC-type amino acid transport substrate-binding protein [Pseudobacteriovorax antillogorgiicola]SMF36973.1 ABC-type amino acid transport substrate-binding protein [Pseudobacteriovorax antillogorgiicola]
MCHGFLAFLFSFAFFQAKLQGSEKTFHVVVASSDDGFPPFSIASGKSVTGGIIKDLFDSLLEARGLNFKPIIMAEKRLHRELKAGRIEGALTTEQWVKKPDGYFFTAPIIRVRDVIFAHKGLNLDNFTLASLKGKKLGVVRGYTYHQRVEDLFRGKQVQRIDAKSEQHLIKLISLKRINYALVTERVGWWIAEATQLAPKIHSSKNDFGNFDYKLLYHGKYRDELKGFDQEIKELGKSALQEVLSRYRHTP